MRAELEWLEKPEIFMVNRLPAHSDHCFYDSVQSFEQGKETLKQSLNGIWKFDFYENVGKMPKDIETWGSELPAEKEIVVPGHIELQGYGQIQYTNTAYPWDGHVFLRPPQVDRAHNPIGFYVKEFDLEEGLWGKRNCISFQGAEEAIYVWLNGSFVGYAQDSFTPSEFDVTKMIRKKGNRLCAAVFKRSSAAWIEDQDFFRFSGLFRDVYLYAKPDTHIEDLHIWAGLDDSYEKGTLELEAAISGNLDVRVTFELLDQEKSVFLNGKLSLVDADKFGFRAEELEDVRKWDVEKPYLYQLLLRIFDAKGKLLEIVPYQVGFRRFEIKNHLMLLNGRRLLINGVNRHEWNPKSGRVISEWDMKRDIEIMKKNHINAVRTCHYPNQSLWYQLCDEAGICVMDEANLEGHGSWQKMGKVEPSWNVPGSRTEWMECCKDRARSMYERDKNHACVLWWSCGNESFMGTVIEEMCHYFHEKDSSRLVHYEGVIYDRKYDKCTDVESRMYASPGQVREYLENDPQKPMLLCEYMHSMGNSLGGLESYMKLRETFPMFQGGFLWDFIDQALYYKNADGKEVLGYGGDFSDRPTDYAFSANGLLFADRTEKAAMQEVRYWYQNEEMRKSWDHKNREAEQRVRQSIMAEGEKRTYQTNFRLQVVYTDFNLGVRGNNFHYIFSYQHGGPVSLKVNGREYLYRAPAPAFWRAATENDQGNGFAKNSAVWMGAESYNRLKKYEVCEQEEAVSVSYLFETATYPSAEYQINYSVTGDGHIRVKVQFNGVKGLPQLPLLGLRFILPERMKEYTYTGLSGETYPDRFLGGAFGTYTNQVEVTKYLVPQECGNHMNTYRMQIGDLQFVMNEKPFHFSVLPYTALQLENALHQEELPDSTRTVVSILGFMRGVGGIDSWGSDVEEDFWLPGDREYVYSFDIVPWKQMP